MDIWEEMYNKAKAEYHPESVSPFVNAHHVVCAIENKDMQIMTDYDTRKTITLGELLPNWWGTKRYEE